MSLQVAEEKAMKRAWADQRGGDEKQIQLRIPTYA
jgi:hypothetical protein